jgi:hypothetical protein
MTKIVTKHLCDPAVIVVKIDTCVNIVDTFELILQLKFCAFMVVKINDLAFISRKKQGVAPKCL